MFIKKYNLMIGNYDDIINNWSSPSVGCCTEMVDIIAPDCSMSQWAVQKTVMELANSDYYYTKDEIDYLLGQVTASGVTREQVEEMIQQAVADKASKADLEALSAQVAANTAEILNRYTKEETNSLLGAYLLKLEAINMRDNYSRVDGDTLILNNEYEITI